MVYKERDRLVADNKELTKALAEAVEANKTMHQVVDGIEELLTNT